MLIHDLSRHKLTEVMMRRLILLCINILCKLISAGSLTHSISVTLIDKVLSVYRQNKHSYTYGVYYAFRASNYSFWQFFLIYLLFPKLILEFLAKTSILVRFLFIYFFCRSNCYIRIMHWELTALLEHIDLLDCFYTCQKSFALQENV